MTQHTHFIHSFLRILGGQLFATGTSLNVIVDFLLFLKLILVFSSEIFCCTIIFECVLRRFSSPRTKLLAARCECLHLIKINCLALRNELRGASCEDWKSAFKLLRSIQTERDSTTRREFSVLKNN